MIDLTMPKLTDSMEEGTIITWLRTPGDRVEVGDELIEIETDKATVTYAAEAAGTLEILVPEGNTVAVGEPVARLDAPAAPQPKISTLAPDCDVDRAVRERGQAAATRSREVRAAFLDPLAPSVDGSVRRASATPLARRTAAFHRLTLGDIEGSGPLGRITRADVLRKAGVPPELADRSPAARPPRPSPAPTPSPVARDGTASPVAGRGSTRQGLSRVQQVIARRMAEAKATIPHFQVQTEVLMDAAVALRVELKKLASEREAPPSFNDIILKAAALALREHPLANGSYKDGMFELHDAINIGIAVATDGALLVPTVFDVAAKSLGQIARETRRLAERVRSAEITPPELAGATFTVSNLGMYGMTAIAPVINPPQAAILGVGAMRETLARSGAEIVDRTQLTLTLSCDHRILYGAEAARFLGLIRDLLEAPLRLAL